VLERAGVHLDALVGSAHDPRERYEGSLDPPPGLVVMTEGAAGGSYSTCGEPAQRFTAVPPFATPVDTYGCGDSFLAGLTFALGANPGDADAAVAFAARCGSACLTGRGAFASQLRLTGGTR
jgi:ribokinase